jgi:dual specificity tyrosine-phosphorylation-regulated kinase 2/3/4
VRVEDFAEIAYTFDMWSLGSILVEILSGFPLWLSLKSRVIGLDGRSITNYGLFGVAGRDHSKILKKQIEILGHGYQSLLQTFKKGFDYRGQQWLADKSFVDMLMQMLSMKPEARINPIELARHAFMKM